MHKIKSKFIMLLAVTMFTGSLNISKSYYPVKAGPRPPNINMIMRNGTEILNYYNGINGLSGENFLAALNQKISGHTEYNYESDNDREVYKIIDRNWALSPLTPEELQNFNYAEDMPYIRKLYADYNDDITTADLFKNPDASRVSFDREHIWAQSLGDFGRTSGAGSDFHALLPADIKGNSPAHSNNNFAVPQTGITNYNNDKGTYVGRTGYLNGASEKVFEPLDQYKGDIARAMFYMSARYFTYVDETHPKLSLVYGSPVAVTANSEQAGLAGDLGALLAWHELDPVDEYEIKRNNLIYNNYQGNRNPFIDFPELARVAYDQTYSGPGASISAGSACLIGNCPYYETSSKTLSSVSISANPTKIDYYVGATLNTSGLEVTAHYTDATSNVITNYNLFINGESSTTFTTSGTKTVTISYEAGGIPVSTAYSVFVANNASLSVTPAVTSIPLASTYSDANLTAELNYSTINGSFVEPISFSKLTVSPVNNMRIGVQTLSVTYLSFQTNFNLTVTNQGASVGNVVSVPDLFFSEYIEGSSNNKALEIYNGTTSSIDLSVYSLVQYNNGSATPGNPLPLSGTIESSSTYVIAHGSSVQTILDVANLKTTAALMGFNGNDAIALLKNGIIIDIIGTPGSADNFAIDTTLVRKDNVYCGVTTYNSAQWNIYPKDTFTHLGSHATNWTSSGISAEEQALAYAQYFKRITGPYCLGGTATNIPWNNLKSEYNFMAASSKDVFFTSTNIEIIDIRARYTLLVNRYQVFKEDNFLMDGDGDLLVINPKKIEEYNSGNALMFLLIMLSSISSVSIYYLIRKKRLEI